MCRKLTEDEEIDLHMAVLFVVLQRPEFKGYEVSLKCIADFTGLKVSTLHSNVNRCLKRLKFKMDRSWVNDL